jgi:putative hydrolase of the HAD superfamily
VTPTLVVVQQSSRPIKAVLWDFGGVITSSPFDGFVTYEQQHGLAPGFIRRLNATNAAEG